MKDQIKDSKVDEKVEKVESGSITDWEILEKAQLVPIRVECQDYRPIHPSDTSCHSNLLLKGEAIKRHMDPEHGAGGGFKFHLRQREGAKNPIWKELKAEKVELHDFRCDVCDEILPLVGRRILKHLQPHSGKSRSVRAGGAFWMTLKMDLPDREEFEEII